MHFFCLGVWMQDSLCFLCTHPYNLIWTDFELISSLQLIYLLNSESLLSWGIALIHSTWQCQHISLITVYFHLFSFLFHLTFILVCVLNFFHFLFSIVCQSLLKYFQLVQQLVQNKRPRRLKLQFETFGYHISGNVRHRNLALTVPIPAISKTDWGSR